MALVMARGVVYMADTDRAIEIASLFHELVA
jgi:hypothetical protein